MLTMLWNLRATIRRYFRSYIPTNRLLDRLRRPRWTEAQTKHSSSTWTERGAWSEVEQSGRFGRRLHESE